MKLNGEVYTGKEGLFERLSTIFDNKHSRAVVYNADINQLNKYVKENPNNFSRIVFSCFDRKKYLYNSDMKTLGLDVILKKSLSACFINCDMSVEELNTNYFSMFENSLGENTLVVIYGFDVKAPTPYMRHLISLGYPLLICAVNTMSGIPKDFLTIDCRAAQNSSVCNIALLDERQRELLITLCGMLYYLDTNTEIKSSKNGVFDKNSVRFYLGDLYDSLDVLVNYNLVSISLNGQILIQDEICEYVFSNFFPCFDNCPTFMKFVEELCNFSVMQNYKDTYARLCAFEGEYNAFISSAELRDVYSFFAKSDENCGHKVYNMLMAMMLCENGLQKGVFNCSHLLWRNRCYYLSLMAEYLRDEEKSSREYDEDLYFDEPLCEIYSHRIKAELDIIRVCVTLIRNVTRDLYKETEYVFEMLLGSLRRIYNEISEYCGDVSEKLCVIDDVLRLCYETFSFADVIDENGKYNCFREDSPNSRVFYTCEKECDSLNASSVAMGYSKTTLSLYGMYQKYISEFFVLWDKENIDKSNRLLYEYNVEKRKTLENVSHKISAMYVRICEGLENFTDYYTEKNKKVKIFDCDFPGDIEKRLADNQRLLRRGFDSGTKTGAVKYGDKIFEVLSKADRPLPIILTVVDSKYPLCGSTYGNLREKGFAELICTHHAMTNLSKQILLENLLSFYKENSVGTEYITLCRELILRLSDDILHNDASLERMFHAVSSMYVKESLCAFACEREEICFANLMYERYCRSGNHQNVYCDDYIANVIFNASMDSEMSVDIKELTKALSVFVFENGHVYDKGIYAFLKKVLCVEDFDIAFDLVKNSQTIQ